MMRTIHLTSTLWGHTHTHWSEWRLPVLSLRGRLSCQFHSITGLEAEVTGGQRPQIYWAASRWRELTTRSERSGLGSEAWGKIDGNYNSFSFFLVGLSSLCWRVKQPCCVTWSGLCKFLMRWGAAAHERNEPLFSCISICPLPRTTISLGSLSSSLNSTGSILSKT